MARKVQTFAIEDEGRDKGKSFVITEWSASQAEKWAIRALLAIGAANIDVPDYALGMGMAALAEVGIKKLFALPYAAAGPLLDELMTCIEVVPDSRRPQVKRGLVEPDIEEVKTRLVLKWAVIRLHADFLLAGDLFDSGKAKVPAEEKRPNTPTSRRLSPSS